MLDYETWRIILFFGFLKHRCCPWLQIHWCKVTFSPISKHSQIPQGRKIAKKYIYWGLDKNFARHQLGGGARIRNNKRLGGKCVCRRGKRGWRGGPLCLSLNPPSYQIWSKEHNPSTVRNTANLEIEVNPAKKRINVHVVNENTGILRILAKNSYCDDELF